MDNKTIEYLELMLKRNEQINNELMNPKIVNDIENLTFLLKEKSQLKKIVELYTRYKNVIKNIKESKNIINFEKEFELLELAKKELKSSELIKEKIENDLKIMLLPKDLNDEKNVIVEIRGAAGGDEGNIFAGDLYRMYLKYAEKQNWEIKLIEENESENGGFSNVSFMLKGYKVYSKMKFESGAHRVQRIPSTESKGRIHTSIATVVVLPEIEEIDFKIKSIDLKIDTYRSSGAGGQHVNTTDSAVRITHIPTGIVVTSQNGRSQYDNKILAMKHLRSKLYEMQKQKINEQIGTIRKHFVGTGDRSEKIRTYNYPQNRVTDHRINLTLQKLDKVIEGNLEEFLVALINEDQRLKMKGD